MHPRILLTSVFKPFAVDSIYARRESILELCHNQLTKIQGPFSPRTYHNTYGLHLIAANLGVPATVLDFPSLDRFRREILKGYDILGIGAILPNFQKVKRMVEETRRLSPRTKIVLGGFCAATPGIEKLMDVDHVCVGEGISFMRDLLGLPSEYAFRNPDMFAETTEMFGIPLFGIRQNPHIVVGLGCSYGCDFCSVTHFFGRKHIRFFRRGRDLFDEMVRVRKRFRTNIIIFVGDDNFLLDLERAEELRQCVVESGEVFRIFMFGSADKAVEFGPEKLAEMGVDTIWIGRESRFADYPKNQGIDIKALVDDLRNRGIKTVLSSILLLDRHDERNIHEDIDEHLACRPFLSQFAHYAPFPHTPLYQRLAGEGRILTAIPFEEWHAFKQPWFIHPHFTLQQAEELQNLAYLRDFHELGPSVARYIQTEYLGWLYLKESAKPHLRARASAIEPEMWKYRVLLNACETLAPSEQGREFSRRLRMKIEKHFGITKMHEKGMGRVLDAAGRFRQLRTRHFGDAIQPRTRMVHYKPVG